MQRSTFTLLFYLKPSTKQSISSPIYLRLTINGIRKAFSINRTIINNDWDPVKQKAKPKSKDAVLINNQIDSLRTNIFETHRVLSDQGIFVTTQILAEELQKPEEEKLDFVQYYLQFIKRKEGMIGVETTIDVVRRHQSICNKFVNFLTYKKITSISFDEFDNEIGQDFFSYLKTACKLSYNTVVKQMQLFKCVIKDAVQKEYLSRDPFNLLRLSVKEIPRPYLIMEEINAISKLEGLVPRLELVRDIFIFSCFTGLAYIDVKQLHSDNMMMGIDGKEWLFTLRQKTGIRSNIPILPKAKEIIEKYKSTVNVRKGHLLPVLTNQKMNAYLKELADKIGTKKILTFHVARHTFSTTVTLTNGVSIESVSKMLGHKLMRTTQHYAKVVDQRVSDDTFQFLEKLKQEKFK
jgi:site-specific recombinase XerD